MGRGRAKAKQQKVARDLKYRPVDTDLASLERELKAGDVGYVPPQYADLVEELKDGEYVDIYGDDDEDDDEVAERR